MSQIPVRFQPVTITKALKALDINQLIAIFCKYVSAYIDLPNVAIIPAAAVTPTSNQGIFYNTTSQQFMVWNTSTGGYTPMGSSPVGDVKESYNTSDDVANGWVVMNGRTIDGITTLTGGQKTNLKTYFSTGVLPTSTGTTVKKFFCGYP